MAQVEEIPMTSEQREEVGRKLAAEILKGWERLDFEPDKEEVRECDEILEGRSVTIGRLAGIRSIHAKYFNPEEPKKCTNLASMKSPE